MKTKCSLELWSLLYRVANLRHSGRARSCFIRALKLVAKGLALVARQFIPDPIVRVEIASRDLLMPWSHSLPRLLRNRPHYESELRRLASHVHQVDGRLRMIDVGANVGDTVAMIPSLPNSKFLCVEGSESYFELLRRNFETDENVTRVFALLGDQQDKSGGLSLVETHGTAHLVKQTDVIASAPWQTLDEVVSSDNSFLNANLLKVDTDGYDLHVLRGATEFLQRAKPCLYVEFSPQHCSTKTPELLSAMAQYGVRNPRIYFNLLAIHPARPDMETFYASETMTDDLNLVA